MSHGNHYNPNQPRRPAGQTGAGEWTNDEGSGPKQISQPESVQLALLKEALKALFTARNFAPRPSTSPRVNPHPEIREPFNPRPPLFPLPLVPLVPDSPDPTPAAEQRALERALLTYNLLSGDNDADRRAAIVFKVGKYQYDSSRRKLSVAGIFRLNEDQLKDVCEKIKDVQGYTDDAYAKVMSEGKGLTNSQRGTEVHLRVQRAVAAANEPNFKAEISHVKSWEETGEEPKPEPPADSKEETVRYGTPKSIRIDVFEKKENVVCIYDIKTGDKRGLSPARMTELAASVAGKYGAVQFLVTEVRPQRLNNASQSRGRGQQTPKQ
jgi:hypothetical protein